MDDFAVNPAQDLASLPLSDGFVEAIVYHSVRSRCKARDLYDTVLLAALYRDMRTHSPLFSFGSCLEDMFKDNLDLVQRDAQACKEPLFVAMVSESTLVKLEERYSKFFDDQRCSPFSTGEAKFRLTVGIVSLPSTLCSL